MYEKGKESISANIKFKIILFVIGHLEEQQEHVHDDKRNKCIKEKN
jgi:hypothetical protein